MKDQAEPIAEDEWVLRRVHENWFVPSNSPAINPYAFKPQIGGDLPDVGGISFYRQSCVAHYNDILAKTDEAKRPKYGIVRLPIAFLIYLGLNVQRDDDLDQPIVQRSKNAAAGGSDVSAAGEVLPDQT
jgi:hypothetical protein